MGKKRVSHAFFCPKTAKRQTGQKAAKKHKTSGKTQHILFVGRRKTYGSYGVMELLLGQIINLHEIIKI